MTTIRTLEIGTLVLPTHARLGLRQDYETIGGRARLRFADGGGLVQQAWSKLRTTIEGEGTVPPGLALLDTVNSLEMKCIRPRSVTGGTTITLPAGRRTDTGSTPRAFAQVGEQVVETALAIVNHVATLTPVAGASLYWVTYWPRLTVICDPVVERGDANAGTGGWTLTAEEI